MSDEIETKKITVRELLGRSCLNSNIMISRKWDDEDYLSIILEKDDIRKRVYYNVKKGRPASNLVDGLYFYTRDGHNLDDYSFIISFEIDKYIRPFIGITNLFLGVVYPYGYDPIKNKVIKFPINEFGLIDENELSKMVDKNYPEVLGYDRDKYTSAIKTGVITYTFRDLIDSYDIVDVAFETIRPYNEKIAKEMHDKIDKILEERRESRSK